MIGEWKEDIDPIIEDLIQYHIREIKALQPYLSVRRMLEDVEKTGIILRAKQLFEEIIYIKLYGNEFLYNEYVTSYIYQSTIIPEVINLTNEIGKAIKQLKKLNIPRGNIHQIFNQYCIGPDLESYNVYNLEHYLGYIASDKDSLSARVQVLRRN